MSQQIATETNKPLVAPLNPAADSRPIVSGAATVGTQLTGIVTTKDGVELEVVGVVPFSDEPLTVIDEYIFDGIGGFLAIEDKRRGLMKAFGGDTIVTLSDGSRHVIAAEVKEANPITPAALEERNAQRGILVRASESDSERAAREEREKNETPEQKAEREKNEKRFGLKFETKEEREAREKKVAVAVPVKKEPAAITGTPIGIDPVKK